MGGAKDLLHPPILLMLDLKLNTDVAHSKRKKPCRINDRASPTTTQQQQQQQQQQQLTCV
jgi:hypothetical protein